MNATAERTWKRLDGWLVEHFGRQNPDSSLANWFQCYVRMCRQHSVDPVDRVVSTLRWIFARYLLLLYPQLLHYVDLTAAIWVRRDTASSRYRSLMALDHLTLELKRTHDLEYFAAIRYALRCRVEKHSSEAQAVNNQALIFWQCMAMGNTHTHSPAIMALEAFLQIFYDGITWTTRRTGGRWVPNLRRWNTRHSTSFLELLWINYVDQFRDRDMVRFCQDGLDVIGYDTRRSYHFWALAILAPSESNGQLSAQRMQSRNVWNRTMESYDRMFFFDADKPNSSVHSWCDGFKGPSISDDPLAPFPVATTEMSTLPPTYATAAHSDFLTHYRLSEEDSLRELTLVHPVLKVSVHDDSHIVRPIGIAPALAPFFHAWTIERYISSLEKKKSHEPTDRVHADVPIN